MRRRSAEVLTGPRLSPVGSGLRTQADPIPVTPRLRSPVSYRSTWDDGTICTATPGPGAPATS